MRTDESTKRPDRLARVATLFVVSACAGLTPFVFSPVTVYLNNSYEFPFPLAAALPLLIVVAVAAGSLVLLVLSLLRQSGRTWGVAIAVGWSVGAWVQGNVLGWSYGQLAGYAIDFGATAWRGWVDAGVWAVVVLVCVVWRGSVTRHATTIVVALLSVQIASALVVAASHEEDPWFLRYHFDYSKEFRFSSKRNVVVLLLDGMMTTEFARTVADDPALASAFDGFTYFRNAVADFSLTQGSLPAILTAERYDDSQPYMDFVKAAYSSRSSLPKLLKEDGYTVDVFGLYRSIWGDPAVMSNVVPNPQGVKAVSRKVAFLADLGLFRSVPHTLKPLVYRNQSWLLSALVRHLGVGKAGMIVELGGNQESAEFGEALARTGADFPLQSAPVFKFIHLQGPHPPLTIDENGHRADLRFNAGNYRRAVHGSLVIASSLLDLLHKRGLYDTSLVLIVSDHGIDLPVVLPRELEAAAGPRGPAQQSRALPLVLVKPPGAQGPLQLSDAPVELSDIPRTVLVHVGIDAAGMPGADMFGLPADSPRERTYFSVADQNWSTSRYLSTMTEFVASGFSWFESSWHQTGRTLGNYRDALRAYQASARVAYLATPSASSSSGDEPVIIATNESGLELSFPASLLEPRRGDWAAVELPFEGLTPDTTYRLSFDVRDDYGDDHPGRLVQAVSLDGRRIYLHDLGAGTFTGATPVEWHFRATSPQAKLRIEVRYVGDPERGWNWGLFAKLGLGDLKLERVAAASARGGA